ncbi:hypothetical protein VTK73DRAFT_6495 [Phialemonium thermophilum]|uniref:Uncharacterized protein n=1 Tax=Phialemonium thermophilum TaxID=223376 RepID=A0ABR3UZD1_9PEZI
MSLEEDCDFLRWYAKGEKASVLDKTQGQLSRLWQRTPVVRQLTSPLLGWEWGRHRWPGPCPPFQQQESLRIHVFECDEEGLGDAEGNWGRFLHVPGEE